MICDLPIIFLCLRDNFLGTTVAVDPNGPKDPNGVPLNYITRPNFGKATSNASFAYQSLLSAVSGSTFVARRAGM